MTNKKQQLIALTLCGLASIAQAGEKEELLKLRNTTTNLIKQLVKQGILTDKMAEDMIRQAEADASKQSAESLALQQNAGTGTDAPEPGEVRVPYVPEFIKDDIRQQVRAELRQDVVKDVMQQAKTQKWGMPEALPEWISRFTLSGDLQLREQQASMGKDNISGPNAALFYPDVLALNNGVGQPINNTGGVVNNTAFIPGQNTTEDSLLSRERLRLGIDAKIIDNLTAGIRLATGNIRDAVSTNQSLGNTGQRYQFTVDRAFLQYDGVNNEGHKWLTLRGGRTINPWWIAGSEFTNGASELVWDTDLSFEGFAATLHHRLGGTGNLYEMNDDSRSMFATVGAFPLQFSQNGSQSKWLFGAQLGLDWGFANQNRLKAGIGYYDYENITARPNTSVTGTCDLNTVDNTTSAPQFVQGGNTLAGICLGGTATAPGTQFGLVGLASNFSIFNPSVSFDIAAFAPHHIMFSADYAKNLGFNAKDVAAARILSGGGAVEEQTTAWQMRVDVGWLRADRWAHWNAFALYKRVERDAVLDAFTDSNFHLGGTNAKGWIIGGNFGLAKNVWMTGRWLSADVITGPKFAIDVLQVDLNTRF